MKPSLASSHPLSAMLAKELRENIRWAALLLATLGVVLGCIYWVFTINFGDPAILSSPLMNPAVLHFQMFAFPAIGLILGLAQLLPEHGRDRFSFLLHRPAIPTTLYLGKVIAGAILYGIVAGIPYLLFVAYARANPNEVDYFTWRFFLPGIADFLAGFGFYFAGLLIAFRNAPWIGSRTVPVFAAIGTSAIALLAGTASLALAGVVLALTIFALAAWGAFLHRASELTRAVAARMALSLVLLAGMGTFFVGIERTGYEEIQYQRYYSGVMAHRQLFDEYRKRLVQIAGSILPRADGTLVQPKYDYKSNVYYLNLDGTPALGPDARHPAAFGLSVDPYEPHGIWQDSLSYRDFGQVVEPYYTEQNGGIIAETHRFYAPYDGLFYYYDRLGNLIGTLGQTGFVAAPERAVPFPPNLVWGMRFTWSAQSLFEWSVENRTAKRLLTLPESETIMEVSAHPLSTGAEEILLLTKNHFMIFDPRANRITFQLPLNVNLPPHDVGAFILAPVNGEPRFMLWYRLPDQFGRIETGGTAEIYSGEGKLLSTQKIPALALPRPIELSFPVVDTLAGLLNGFAVPWASTVFPHAYAYYNLEMTPSERDSFYQWASFLPSPLAALLLFLLTRRYAFPRTTSVIWPLLTLLLGPIGLFVFLATHPLPRRIPCTACGKPRIITRDLCEHCAAPFPPPRPNGTEIFADHPKPPELVPT